MFDPAAVFLAEFQKALKEQVDRSGYPTAAWFNSGPSKPETDIAMWMEKGPLLVRKFIRWFDGSGAKVWVTPDGVPAVELDLQVRFGDIPVITRPDVVLDMGGALVVADYKTGRKPPQSLRQLAVGAGAIEVKYGVRPAYGAWYMGQGIGPRDCPPEELTYLQQPVPLAGYQHSVAYLTGQFRMFVEARDKGLFLANPGEFCRTCGVSRACPETGGVVEGA